MKRLLRLSVFAALTLTCSAAFAEDTCTKITATGHPQYPVIAFKDGDNIVGAAPSLVDAVAKKINVPLENKYMGTWADAQAATKDGKADMIYGIYYNDERATYLDYVQPAFVFDPVVGGTTAIDLVLALNKLALVGDEPRTRFERALQILRKLEAAGQLAASQKGWIAALEQGLAALPKQQ